MSTISKSMLRQTSLLYRVLQTSLSRQVLLPFGTSVQRLAEQTAVETTTKPPVKENEEPGQAFDTVPIRLGRLGKVLMVLGGRYPRVRDVPDVIPHRVYQRTKDRFRARCVVLSLFGTGILCYIAATRGKTAHKEGKRYTDSVYDMHRGESRLHEKLEEQHLRSKRSARYSPEVDEVNK